jgi:hypothetical protein
MKDKNITQTIIKSTAEKLIPPIILLFYIFAYIIILIFGGISFLVNLF